MKKTNVAVFGAGNMGKNHVREWAAVPGVRVAYVIDTNPAVQKIAEEFGAEFVNMDISTGIRTYDTDMNPEWCAEERKKLYELGDNTDIWSIATPTNNHAVYLGSGLDFGKKIFLEKPTTDSPEITEIILNEPLEYRFGRTKRENTDPVVQVDYIEMAHPVLSAIIDDMNEKGFDPAYSINWRGKDLRNNPRGLGGGQGSRIVLEDLVHDISQIMKIRNENPHLKKWTLPDPLVEAEIKTWHEKYGNDFPYSTDVEANFKLTFLDNAAPGYYMPPFQSVIIGGFDQDEERRYFALRDEGQQNAYFGQTLARDNKGIEPVAVRIGKEKNVKRLTEHAENGTAQRYEEVIHDCDGEIIDLGPYLLQDRQKPGMVPLAKMIRNLHESNTSSDLICPIRDAIGIERIAEIVYKAAGKPEAMEYRIIE